MSSERLNLSLDKNLVEAVRGWGVGFAYSRLLVRLGQVVLTSFYRGFLCGEESIVGAVWWVELGDECPFKYLVKNDCK
jgi:hypothetical protein